MSTDDPARKSIAERLAAEAAATAARKGVEEAAAGARKGVEKAAEGALDAMERMLFGKVGGADEVLRREATADPLERLRLQYGEAPAADPQAPPPAKEDPMAVARRQLEEIKRQRAARAEAGGDAEEPAEKPIKRTL